MLVAQLGLTCSYLWFVKLDDLRWITFTVPGRLLAKKEKDSFQVKFTWRIGFKDTN